MSNANRIKCLRKLSKLSQAAFASRYNVAQTAVSNWEQFRNSIDIITASKIARDYKVPVEFVYGFDFDVTRPMNDWTPDQIEDMVREPHECKDFFLYRYGFGRFATTYQDPEEDKGKVSYEEELKIALFGGDTEVTDEMWQKLMEYAKFLKLQHNEK